MNAFSIALALSIFAGALTCGLYARAVCLDTFTMGKLLFFGVLGGLLASRMAFIAFNIPLYAGDPMALLRPWEGGYMPAFGLYGGVACAYCAARRLLEHPYSYLDAAAVPLLLFLGIAHAVSALGGEGQGFMLAGGDYFPLYILRALYCGAAGMAVWFLRRRIGIGEALPFAFALYAAGGVVLESMARESVYLMFVRVEQVLYILVLLLYAARLCLTSERRIGIAGGAWLMLMTCAAFLLEFYMGYDTQYLHWALMALCMAGILVLCALLIRKGAYIWAVSTSEP